MILFNLLTWHYIIQYNFRWLFSANGINNVLKRRIDPLLADIKPSFIGLYEIYVVNQDLHWSYKVLNNEQVMKIFLV